VLRICAPVEKLDTALSRVLEAAGLALVLLLLTLQLPPNRS
jgi:hypothetical protein